MEHSGDQNSISSLESVKKTVKQLFETLYLRYKSKEYREKLVTAEKSLEQLVEMFAENEEGRKHIENIEAFIKLLMKENKVHTVKELFFTILHIVTLYCEVKD
jgi:ABC-type enterochelin transport system substrate-binding protein